jgi:hypothetical protein
MTAGELIGRAWIITRVQAILIHLRNELTGLHLRRELTDELWIMIWNFRESLYDLRYDKEV